MWKRYPGIQDLEFNAEGEVRWNASKDDVSYLLISMLVAKSNSFLMEIPNHFATWQYINL